MWESVVSLISSKLFHNEFKVLHHRLYTKRPYLLSAEMCYCMSLSLSVYGLHRVIDQRFPHKSVSVTEERAAIALGISSVDM